MAVELAGFEIDLPQDDGPVFGGRRDVLTLVGKDHEPDLVVVQVQPGQALVGHLHPAAFVVGE